MTTFATATELLVTLAVGGLLGALGQGIRSIVGLKKLADEASSEGKDLAEILVPSRLVVSLLIGFIAGALGILPTDVSKGYSPQTIAMLIGIGYSGADFIEGFAQKHLPSSGGPKAAATVPAVAEPDEPAMG